MTRRLFLIFQVGWLFTTTQNSYPKTKCFGYFAWSWDYITLVEGFHIFIDPVFIKDHIIVNVSLIYLNYHLHHMNKYGICYDLIRILIVPYIPYIHDADCWRCLYIDETSTRCEFYSLWKMDWYMRKTHNQKFIFVSITSRWHYNSWGLLLRKEEVISWIIFQKYNGMTN